MCSHLLPSPVPLELATEADPLPRLRAAAGRHRVRHRVYADERMWAMLRPWERYCARVHAYALAHPEAVFCLESAAALLGLPVFGEPRDIHVLDSGGGHSHRRGDVLHHTSRNERAVTHLTGLRLTAPTDTVVDLAAALPPAFALAVADALVAPRQFAGASVAEFRNRSAELAPRRGGRQLSWVCARVDDRAESPGESVSRAVIEWLGFPEPELQKAFRFEGHRDRGDFWWQRCGVLGESDGYAKYDDPDPVLVRRHFSAEKVREDRLRRHVRSVTRWGWEEAMKAEPLARRLVGAGVATQHPRNARMLATLSSHPRSLAPAAKLPQTPRTAGRPGR